MSCFGGTLVFAAFGSSPGSLRRGLTGWLLSVGGKNAVVEECLKEIDPDSIVIVSACAAQKNCWNTFSRSINAMMMILSLQEEEITILLIQGFKKEILFCI